MLRELMPHQVRALHYLKQKNGGALFMQMRLGKTLVSIRFLQGRLPKSKRILVLAPLEGLWAWQRELEMEKELFVPLTGTKKQRLSNLDNRRGSWFLINYEGYRSIEKDILLRRWDAIILDESRRIANPKSKTSKSLLRFPNNGEFRIILSGEPAPEGPLEYFNQFAFLNGSFAGCRSYWHFRNSFFQELAPHEWVPFPNRLERLKEEIHSSAFFLSRKEAGIPDKKIYESRTVQFPPEIREMYEGIKKEFVASLKGRVLKTTKWVPVQYTWLHQISSGFLGDKFLWNGKVKILLNLINGELKNEQCVVWFKFNAPLFVVSKSLEAAGIRHGKLVGSLSRIQREAAIDKFRSGKIRVLLCQIKCAKSAIDLSNSSTAIYFSNSYSLEERLQSEDRILNPKKREPLLYLDLFTEGSVEQDIIEIVKSKSGDSKFFMSKLISSLKKEAA